MKIKFSVYEDDDIPQRIVHAESHQVQEVALILHDRDESWVSFYTSGPSSAVHKYEIPVAYLLHMATLVRAALAPSAEDMILSTLKRLESRLEEYKPSNTD